MDELKSIKVVTEISNENGQTRVTYAYLPIYEMARSLDAIEAYIEEHKRKETWIFEQGVKSFLAKLDAMGIPEMGNQVEIVEE